MIGLLLLILILSAFTWGLVQRFFLQNKGPRLSMWLCGAASLLYLAVFISRSIAIKFFAITSLYESLLFLSMILLFLLFYLRTRTRKEPDSIFFLSGLFFVFLITSLLSSPIVPADLAPPVPILRSFWLIIHVTLTFIGEAFFTLAFLTAILYLFSPKKSLNKKKLDELTYRFIIMGYPFYTLGALIFGAVWAYNAWGRFWGWDPKEIWALITWLTYTFYLHQRLVRKKTGIRSALTAVIGFLITLFTLFGVSYLLNGLHSYL